MKVHASAGISPVILMIVCLSIFVTSPVFAYGSYVVLPQPSPSAPAYGSYIILQQKSKFVMDWSDFQRAGDQASTPTERINNYMQAESKLAEMYKYKPTDAAYYLHMGTLERTKANAYEQLRRSFDEPHDNLGMPYRIMEWTEANAKSQKADENADMLSQKYTEKYQEENKDHGCLIVTAAFGSPLAGEVQLVRDYRDSTIRQSYTGSQFFLGFNAWYYTFSPAVADYIATHPLVKSVMQVCLVPLLEIVLLSQNLYVMLGFSPELATVCVLLFGAALYSLTYIFPPAFLTVWLAKRNGWMVPTSIRMKPVLLVWIFVLCGLAAGIVLSIDILTIVLSGLLVATTVVLIAGTSSLALIRYLENRSCIRQV